MLPCIFSTFILCVIPTFHPLFPWNAYTLPDKDFLPLVFTLAASILLKYLPSLIPPYFTEGPLLLFCLLFMFQVNYTKQNIWRKSLHMRESTRCLPFWSQVTPLSMISFSSSIHSSLNFIISFSFWLTKFHCICVPYFSAHLYMNF